MSDSAFRPPAGPRIFPFRPLNKGIHREITPTEYEPGMVYTAANYVVGQRGLQRAHGRSQEFGGNVVSYPPVRGYDVFFSAVGTQVAVLWDEKFLYSASASTFTPKYWSYAVGTAKTSGTFIVASATSNFTNPANYIAAGDIVSISAGASLEILEVASVVSSHVLLSTTTPAFTHPAGRAYEVRRAFGAYPPLYVDTTVVDNKLVVADGTRPLMAYDGSDFTIYDASLTFLPTCVAFHVDRLWVGRPNISTTDFRHRIMWTTTLDKTDFGTVGTDQFVDRPYAPGALKRLVGMGPYLVAYFDDAIDIGRPSNIAGDVLPLAWDRLQTGGVGLVGPKAVTKWLDGHFFVGQDDIYYLGLQGGIERIGTPVISATIDACQHLDGVWVVPDVTNTRIVFGFPESTEVMTKLWSFDYKAKAWSYTERSATALGFIQSASLTNDDLSTVVSTIDSLTAIFPTIASMGSSAADRRFVYGTYDGYTFKLDAGVAEAISCVLETGDLDLGEPDRVKSAYRTSLRIDRVLSSDLVYTVQGSTNEGVSWRTLGSITIPAGRDEGFCNFQLTGSTLRLRFSSSSSVPAYFVVEYTMKIKGRGIESFFGGSD